MIESHSESIPESCSDRIYESGLGSTATDTQFGTWGPSKLNPQVCLFEIFAYQIRANDLNQLHNTKLAMPYKPWGGACFSNSPLRLHLPLRLQSGMPMEPRPAQLLAQSPANISLVITRQDVPHHV